MGAAVFHSWERKAVGGSASVLPCRYECVLELWLVVVQMCDKMADKGTGKVRGVGWTGNSIVACCFYCRMLFTHTHFIHAHIQYVLAHTHTVLLEDPVTSDALKQLQDWSG